ncbi:hypothetical protein XA68_17814 [Ophiocordyceps unilateralis]|uniref:Aminoglycoside phosphotransferase domain-containing protein n=1 Tax=Ophiocordyceps unilateralis TaxID=268505 RepID=A0A2A9P4B5_OPHUN|nr:hypothetical protein XA68_17814 [Ophiocordyceps unilateralis]
MPVHDHDPQRVAEIMLGWLNLELVSCSKLQTLWAGYGHICALEARSPHSSTTQHLILKLVSPPPAPQPQDEGHVRKMLSYQVEQFWYDELAPKLGSDVAVARCLVSTRSRRDRAVADGIDGLIATIMTDLRLRFPVAGHKTRSLAPAQVHAALDWLACFHGSSKCWLPRHRHGFLGPPLQEADGPRVQGLWRNGGYTYLATRRREYGSLAADDENEWSHAFCRPGADGQPPLAEQVATFLIPRGRAWETCIHGDVKSENLFATKAGDEVAFFDFQYVGLGLGVCDVAKLFTGSVPLHMLADLPVPARELSMGAGERALLERYRAKLVSQQPTLEYDWDSLVRHWETALVDWCRFQASWGFWGNTGWLQARVRCILGDGGWREWLRREGLQGGDKS